MKRASKPRVKPQYFTGKVTLKEIANTGPDPKTFVFDVKFYRGARTKIHSHTGGQILYCTSGKGSLVTYKRASNAKRTRITKVSRITLSPGKAVFIPPKTLHTHGSVSKTITFSHIAVNLATRSSEMITTWFDSDLATWLEKID